MVGLVETMMTADGLQLAALDQADGDPPLRRGRGDAEDVGANDVRALAPGVYFVREAQAQAQAQAVRKVVKLK
jgi:hypothetical protein